MKVYKCFLILLAVMISHLAAAFPLEEVLYPPMGLLPTTIYPPAHAPAYGRRAQQRYRYNYLPDAQIYFDQDRKLYFYISANHWKVSVSLPGYLRERLHGHHVRISGDGDREALPGVSTT